MNRITGINKFKHLKLKIYHIDTFTDNVFSGNPAAVCPLDYWLTDEVLQKIARENYLPATAFYVRKDNTYQVRWFTPTTEIELCGHATLATAFVLFNFENHAENLLYFYSDHIGTLTVTKEGEYIALNLPTDPCERTELTETMIQSFNIKPQAAFKSKVRMMFLFANESAIQNLSVDFNNLSDLQTKGVIVTAKGNEVDFVSRYFTFQSGLHEDPVTGSAHTTLIPYWAQQLNKSELTAIQLSERKGYLKCRYFNDRIEISGQAKLYLKGEIYIN